MALLAGLLIPAVIVSAFLVRARASVDDAFLADWAKAHALELTPHNRGMVEQYLRKARVLRTAGVLTGLIVPNAVKGLGNPGVWMFIGYLVGALYAEVTLSRPGGRGAASLVPRHLLDYVPAKIVWVQRVLPAAAVLGAAILQAFPYRDPRLHVTPRPWVLAMAIGVAGFAVAIEAIETWVVRRPQPIAAADLMAADDAIRSQSVHSISGSLIAIELVVIAVVCWSFEVTDVRVLRWFMWVPAMAATFGSLFALLYFGHRAWRVRRPFASAVPQT